MSHSVPVSSRHTTTRKRPLPPNHLLVPEKVNQTQASEYCQQKGGYLAAPQNTADWHTLATAVFDDQDSKLMVANIFGFMYESQLLL